MSTETTSETSENSYAPDVVVEQAVQAPLAAVWDAAISSDGAQILLGEGASYGDKGDSWEANDGVQGVMRSFHPREQLRFSWHERAGDPATLVTVNFTGEGSDATHVEIKHTKLPAGADDVVLRERWEKTIDRLTDLAER